MIATGLTAGTTYSFKVAAINIVGTSTPSSLLSILAATVPEPPTDLTIDTAYTSAI